MNSDNTHRDDASPESQDDSSGEDELWDPEDGDEIWEEVDIAELQAMIASLRCPVHGETPVLRPQEDSRDDELVLETCCEILEKMALAQLEG